MPTKAVSKEEPKQLTQNVVIHTTPLPTGLPVVSEKKPIKVAIPAKRGLNYVRVEDAEKQVREIAIRAGYTPKELQALITLLGKESGVQPNRVNTSSHACGLFQRLPCPWKLSTVNGMWVVGSSIETQMSNGLAYIKNRYGAATNALRFWYEHHWY